MPADDELIRARSRVEALRTWLAARDAKPVRLIETHISWVLLTEASAYKLKKPLRLPFLDFTTLERRRHFCEEELRLNRRLAPSLYLDVVEVREDADGVRLEGPGAVAEVAVRMRRFPDGALWSDMLAAGTLAAHHVDAMARRLHEFHQAAPVAPAGSAFGSAAVNERVTRRVVEAIDAWNAARELPDARWPALRAWIGQQLHMLAAVWDARRREGRVRECHGDLHLANVLQLGDEAAAFDGIEFDDELRWIDVLSDIAFLVMDLLAHGRRDLAFRLLDGWLEASGDHAGLPALRFFLVYRALVRAQVAAIGDGRGHDAGVVRYLALAAELAAGDAPRLVITHGLPGSGKTHQSQEFLEAAGAVRVRSDVERKRLFGLSALQSSRDHVPGGIYDSATTARTYARLLEVSRIALQAGWPIVVDAAFLRRSERAEFALLADSLGLPFHILDCHAPPQVLRRRIEERQAGRGDASEADVAVLERLMDADEPLDRHERAAVLAAAP